MKRVSLLLLLAALAACDDGPSGPEPAASVSISLGTAPADQPIDLVVGDTVRLSATPANAAGEPLLDRRVDWQSLNPAVATVDGGLVRGVGAGTAQVVASIDAAADTVRVVVYAPAAGGVACTGEQQLLSLEVGEVRTFTGDQARALCLGGGTTGADYTLIAFDSALASNTARIDITGAGLTAPGALPNPSLLAGPRLSALRPAGAGMQRDWSFHNRLLARNRAVYQRLRRTGGLGPRFSRAAAIPVAGDFLTLNANADSACTSPSLRTGRVEAITQHAIVVSDTSNPAGGLTQADYVDFGQKFDNLVWTVDTRNFGEPSDIDQNGHVIIFFTVAVNELTEDTASSYVGGFFYSRDLAEKAECLGSNGAEMFYMLVPDTARARRGNPTDPAGSPFSTQSVKEQTAGVLAHEFQHLINASRRAFVNDAPSLEEPWLDEGLAHIAEELTFYQVSGMAPGQNLDLDALTRTQASVDAVNQYQISNLGRYWSYLESPEQDSPLQSDLDQGGPDLATRGAIWAFLRYAADRKGGTEQQTWFSLVNSQATGTANLSAVLGADPLAWMQDWSVANYTDDALIGASTVLPVDAAYRQPSWDYREILSFLNGTDTRPGPYPLLTRPLRSGQTVRLTLVGGGSGYVRFGVSPTTLGSVQTLATNGQPASPSLRVSVVRTR